MSFTASSPAAGRFIEPIRQQLLSSGSFSPRSVGAGNAVFTCVCGPYWSCKPEAESLAEQLEYVIPNYDFTEGLARKRQKVIFFFASEVASVEMSDRKPYLVLEHDGFCDTNPDRMISDISER